MPSLMANPPPSKGRCGHRSDSRRCRFTAEENGGPASCIPTQREERPTSTKRSGPCWSHVEEEAKPSSRFDLRVSTWPTTAQWDVGAQLRQSGRGLRLILSASGSAAARLYYFGSSSRIVRVRLRRVPAVSCDM